MDFAGVVERIKLNLGIGNDAVREALGIGAVTFENYLNGYAEPPTELVQRLFSRFSVLNGAGTGARLWEKIPDELDRDELIRKIFEGRRVAVSVDKDLPEAGIYAGCDVMIELGSNCKAGDAVMASVGSAPPELCLCTEGGSGLLVGGKPAEGVKIVGRVVCVVESINTSDDL